ncbi:MAG: RHS repeat-associated core domain-containing protein, partial [Bryobacteraceae bacterium]|nr:RHS repeat-associated core domain-containing protein [Bryobacteraceae bacterium]
STAGWVQTYQFDGFGNLYRKNSAGGAPWADWTAVLDSEKNRVTAGGSFDAAGNHLWNGDVSYDYENRMRTSPGEGIGWKASYEYSADNNRVVKRKTAFPLPSPQDTSEVTLWANGQRVAVRTAAAFREFVGFAGRRFSWTSVNGPVELEQGDRLGSTVETMPFGEEMTASSDDKTKFATYWRDASTGLDYADQRYYAPGSGRFMSADPYQASAGAGDPGSWNRYSYVEGDPVNRVDATGLAYTDLHFYVGGEIACYTQYDDEGTRKSLRCFSGFSRSGPNILPQPEAKTRDEAELGWLRRHERDNEELAKRLHGQIQKCADGLASAGVDTKALQQSAASITFWNTTVSAVGQLTISDVAGPQARNGATYLRSAGFAGSAEIPNASALEVSNSGGGFLRMNQVALHSGFYGLGEGDQNLTLVHEALHVFMNIGPDFALASELGAGAGGVNAWLKTICAK